jgi:DNA polymerase IIIc chi subunit
LKSDNKNILRTYLNRLTNLTGNNRSILLLRLPKEQFIDLHKFNFLDHKSSFSIITALLAGKSIKLCQILDSRMELNNEISLRLKRLQRIDKFIFEERGSNDLHVGWPFIRGKLADGSLVRAPLLFFPVTLVQSRNDWMLVPREDAGIVFNKSFALAYAFYNKVELSDELLDTTFEDFSPDSTVWRTQLYQLLKEKVELNFNADNFRDELIPFEEFDKATFQESHRSGEIKLFPESVLGIFPQAGSQLVPDYTYLLDAENFRNLEDFFVRRDLQGENESPDPPTLLDVGKIKEEKLYAPFDIDAWQENAIKTIKTGKSIVVQGPPGTGKSQLICNLIADSIASGKKVLVVSQKRAALDVVFGRLQEIDMDDFLGLVHDFRNDRKEVFEKIAKQIDRIEDYRARNRSVDSIHMERKFFQLSRRIDNIVEELDEFKKVLYDESECGLSIKELYLLSSPNEETINIKQEYQFIKFSDIDDFLRKIKSYVSYASSFIKDRYVWNNRKSFASLNLADMRAMTKVVKEIPSYLASITKKIRGILPLSLTLQDCESLLGREDDILGMLSVLKDDETYAFFTFMLNEKEEETSLLWLSNIERVLMNCYEGMGPEIHTPLGDLGKLQKVLRQCMVARRSLIRFIRWEFSDNKYFLKRILVLNDLPYSKEGLKSLEQRLDSRLNLEHHFTALKGKSWLTDLPVNYRKEEFRRWFERKKLAVRSKIIFNTIREVKDALDPSKISRYEFNRIFHELLSVCAEIPVKKSTWMMHLTPFQIRQLIHEPMMAEEYVSTLKSDFDNLCEFDKLRASLMENEIVVIHKLYDQVGRWELEKFEPLLRNSLALSWIDYIETKHPSLRMVSSMRLEELQAELWQSIREKQRLSKEIILLRTREQVYENLEYNRLNNRITYRGLHHQTTKQKKLWPIRRVIAEMQDDLLRLIPCWLGSPEAISAIFPMKEIFDLVIFDEASQCFAERGLPAMYRGRQVVVAGDGQQLKPFELYQVRWEEEQQDEPDSEVDSLLELAERYLQSVNLQGHYRSRSPELIDFSNRHFYNGRLKLLPDRKLLNANRPAIGFHKVEGIWEQNTNRVEAEAVVRKVFGFIDEFPNVEVGVVTFNAPQQYLILDLLENEASTRGISLPVSLFVKNIENVQGDEKDVIIFSIGYAPDKKGKMIMHFGSLNVAGGENRLNVAVTRARMQVIIITSIWPEQLRVHEARNEGPKLLKAYLEFCRKVQNGEFVLHNYSDEKHTDSWYLKTHLKKLGEEMFPQADFQTDVLPFTDLCIRQNNTYLGAILTDDERYLNSLSAKDVHAYTLEHLTQKKWEYRYIFSRNYWLDREKVENDLMRMVGIQNG